MKYKVGDEVLVKAKIIAYLENRRYAVMANVATTVDISLIDKIYIREEDINELPDVTADEAWEIAKKLFADYSNAELDEIFGKGWSYPKLMELTPQQAKAKIAVWEAEKEIKVGDVVKDCNGKIGVVISKGSSDNVLFSDGNTWNYTERTLEKTGSHIDIEWLLQKIGGDE